MKKFIFCLIAIAAITMLLLPSGKAYAWCIKFDDFSFPALDSSKWDVKNDGNCYTYSITPDGKLEVVSQRDVATCTENDRIFFIPKTSRQVRSIRAEVTQSGGDRCHRARVIADPVALCSGEPGFIQLAIMQPRWDPRTSTLRFHCDDPGLARYMPSDGSGSVYDGLFKRNLFPGDTNDKTYILYLRVGVDGITSRIKDEETGKSLGTIVFRPPEGVKNRGHVLGLSCFGPSLDSEVSSGTVYYDNVYLCF